MSPIQLRRIRIVGGTQTGTWELTDVDTGEKLLDVYRLELEATAGHVAHAILHRIEHVTVAELDVEAITNDADSP